MSYPQGYQQQQQNYQQQQQYGGGGGYSDDEDTGGRPSPAVAMIAVVLGLVAAACLVVFDVRLLDAFSGAIGDLPGQMQTVLALHAVGALILLVGVILVFVRKSAAAILLALGGLVGAAAVVTFPMLFSSAVPGLELGLGDYFKEIFKFGDLESTVAAIGLIASVLTVILALLPPTRKYLRRSTGSSGYDDFPQQPGGGYPQTPASGYPQSHPHTPQSGYPQQGYPQQPQQPGW